MVDECFIDCIGALLSNIGDKAQIEVKIKTNCKILKTFGKQWVQSENLELRKINIRNVQADREQDFLCLIEVGPLSQLGEVVLLEAVLCYESEGNTYKKSGELRLETVDSS